MRHAEMLISGHFVGGPCDQSTGKLVIKNPFDGTTVGTAAEGAWNEANGALQAAVDAFEEWQFSTTSVRQVLLRRIAELVRERTHELAELLVLEIGKPITWARAEVARLAITFDLAATELDRWGAVSHDLSYDKRGEHYSASYTRVPRGPILAIVPYNWPFNLSAHKIAPALATGNTLVVKPSQLAPISTLTLVRLIHEAGCPAGVINAVNVPGKVAEKLAVDDRTKMVSFTGSPAVGWHLKQLCFAKQVSLELGGDAFALVWEDADLDWAVKRIVAGKYGYAGQICISIQHVLAHESIYDQFRDRLKIAVEACPTGDPRLEETVCGPMISEEAADKVCEMVDEALQLGARSLVPLRREGNLIFPTLVEDVPRAARLASQEVFGPVLTLSKAKDVEEMISRVNASQFGIHLGMFCNTPEVIEAVFEGCEIGGVLINDYPTLRFDGLPYGGVKQSGHGREGVRFAMEDMTYLKSLVIKV